MNPKKQKQKDRRRARKLAEEAWEAANGGNLDLAEKVIRRAVAAQEDNPVLWNDQGMLLALRNKDREAVEAFRAAISLAPTYADPYSHLAAIRLRQGSLREAVILQAQAVKWAPENLEFSDRLAAYEALAGQDSELSAQHSPEAPPATGEPIANGQTTEDLRERLDSLDWHTLGERLARDGCAVIAKLIDVQVCEALGQLFDNDGLFAKTVVMDRPGFGKGTYRYFGTPLPDEVVDIRQSVYSHVAGIANRWQELLGESARFALEWEGFRMECELAGQTTPTPILLKYGPGGFNSLHQDLRGALFFPIQLAVVLSPRADERSGGFEGGNFLFCDVPEGRKSRRLELPLGQGDAVLFCTRDRLVRVGGTYGLQPVKHGVSMITAGERLVLGVPFHEYR